MSNIPLTTEQFNTYLATKSPQFAEYQNIMNNMKSGLTEGDGTVNQLVEFAIAGIIENQASKSKITVLETKVADLESKVQALIVKVGV